MKHFLRLLLVAVTTAVAIPHAFASGYGPAPHYEPTEGAPASQRGESAQTVAAEHKATETQGGVGGVASSVSQSGSRFIDPDAHH